MNCINNINLESILEMQQNTLLYAEKNLEYLSTYIQAVSTIIAAITAICTIITVYIAYISISYVKKEYELHKKIRHAEILSTYNERYSTDNHIEKVIRYLHNDLKLSDLELNDREMFMRFYEELQYTIEQEGISKEIVYDMFAYYAMEIAKKGKEFIDDYGEENWRMFLKFIDSMDNVKKLRESKHRNRFFCQKFTIDN